MSRVVYSGKSDGLVLQKLRGIYEISAKTAHDRLDKNVPKPIERTELAQNRCQISHQNFCLTVIYWWIWGHLGFSFFRFHSKFIKPRMAKNPCTIILFHHNDGSGSDYFNVILVPLSSCLPLPQEGTTALALGSCHNRPSVSYSTLCLPLKRYHKRCHQIK